MPATVFLGLGSNQERQRHLAAALVALRARFGPLRVSGVYESPAEGQPGAPPYYNLAAAFDTAESPQAVQAELKAIERRQGRVPQSRGALHCPLDIDFLLYGGQIIRQPGLVLPRPGFTGQAYVLGPLAELAPDMQHPQSGERMAELWTRCPAAHRPVRLPGGLTGWRAEA
jgi:2-amino-4-hydroxy-6-hydroxymethyldihydropteridine diphosphokinase